MTDPSLTAAKSAFVPNFRTGVGRALVSGLSLPQSVGVVMNIAIQACGIATAVLIARRLGPEGRGAVAVVVVWVSLYQAILYLNIPEAVAFLIARAPASFVQWRAAGFITAGMLGVFACMIGYFTLPLLLPPGNAELLRDARFFLVSIPLFFITVVWNAAYAGRHQFHRYNILRVAHPAFYLSVLVAMFLFRSINVFHVLVANVLAHIGVAGVLLAYALRDREPMRFIGDQSSARAVLLTGASFHGTTLITVLLSRVDQYMVSRLFMLDEMGIYAVAATVAGAQTLIANAFAQIITPLIAGAAAESAVDSLVQQFRWALRCSVALGLVIAAASPAVVPLVFGNAFAGAARVIWFLVPGYIAFGLSSLLSLGLRGLDHPYVGTVCAALAGVAFFSSVGVLTHHFRLAGIAGAIGLGNCVMMIGLIAFVSGAYGVPVRRFLFK